MMLENRIYVSSIYVAPGTLLKTHTIIISPNEEEGMSSCIGSEKTETYPESHRLSMKGLDLKLRFSDAKNTFSTMSSYES